MPLPRGAHYVRGSGRTRVQMIDGRVLSRQQAENQYARSLGARNDYELRQARRAASAPGGLYGKQSYRARQAEARAQGFLTSGEFANAAAIVSAQGHAGQLDKSPGGALDMYLRSIGRRTGYENYAVGETPNAAA